MRIRNLPEYAFGYKYIVYRRVDGECWFYGAYNSILQSENVASDIGGFFVSVEEVYNEHDIV